jgi:hypothetical protein
MEQEQGNAEILENYAGQNVLFQAEIISWEKIGKFMIKTTDNDTWYLITNRDNIDIADNYTKRFKIENFSRIEKEFAFDINKF